MKNLIYWCNLVTLLFLFNPLNDHFILCRLQNQLEQDKRV